MCGIFGYVGSQPSVEVCLEGLLRLEYRGYDSAGIAGVADGQVSVVKTPGKVRKLQHLVNEEGLELETAIAHTRWATHGPPTEVNAHPHTDAAKTLALVHNGIIENHSEIRAQLEEEGVHFCSETDTEVVAHLVSKHYDGDILRAVQQAVPLLEGSFSLAVVHRDHPNTIIATAQESPLAVGIGSGEVFLASDTHAFLAHTREVIFLGDGEVAVIQPEEIAVYDATMAQVLKKREVLEHRLEEASKGEYEHYTLKEIFEQPQTIRNALLSRYVEGEGNAMLEGLNLDAEELRAVERVLILACGTSYHAGMVAAYMLENRARLSTQVEISSEFRYKNPIVHDNTLVIAISQSGETADTIAAVRELKAKGAKIVSICNVHGSTLARESHGCLFLRAGVEIGVCSTKAFTSQLVVLSLLGLYLARMRDMSQADGAVFLQELRQLPEKVDAVLSLDDDIRRIAEKYAGYDNFFFLGRQYMFPAALEGALKLKEISYINANGYPAGEMKHGPIALINEECPTVALCGNALTLDKMISNLREVKARNGSVISIVAAGAKGVAEVSDDVIEVPPTLDELAAVPMTVVTQLLAYHIAHFRGAEIDQPRNLAKSVTVE